MRGRTVVEGRRWRAPSLRTFARVMLGARILGLGFALLWIYDGFAWVKVLAVVMTAGLVSLQVSRLRGITAREKARGRASNSVGGGASA